MNIRRHMLSTFAVVALVLVAASAAQAQATRTWVSGVGNDVDPCSRTAPCKTYAGALIKTAAGGEISTLDPGGFGAVNINKSIMIEGTKGQGYGSILASNTTGVTINDSLAATPNTAIVTLRNISINGAGSPTGSNGIRFIAGKAVHVEDCQIINFRTGNGRGISVELSANASQILTVKDTFIKECSGQGIRIANSAGAVNAFIDNSRIERCATGVLGAATSVTMIRNTTIGFNTSTGVRLENAASSINIENSFIQGHPADGIIATAGTVRLGRSTVVNNANGLDCAGGTIASYGDNALEGNGTLQTGCPTPLTPLLKK
ncbi:MAG TPA: right-handed parallel beta-helix repeat-containing protein [Pyrinomonadaceae bacterium]|nr:right-handed parallel beta-helix repeat-containing protein [Pyrinomonadaceae bacterium]